MFNYTKTYKSLSKIQYMDMGNQEYSKLSKYIYKTYPNACICWIEIINNDFLYARYIEKQMEMEDAKTPLNQKLLFHGTNPDSASIIKETGFKAKLNKISAHGLGSYFSTRAAYSKEYSRESPNGLAYMFICDVLIGNYCQGKAYTPITQGYDSGVDNIKNPDMYIVPDDRAIYPKYLVSFYPKAK